MGAFEALDRGSSPRTGFVVETATLNLFPYKGH